MIGAHAITHWSTTQTSTALSSGEAEFAGVVRGSGQGLGFQALLKDLGVVAPLRVWTDSSAAIGICSRQGLGKLRHIDTHNLWVQQAVRTKRVDLRKVPGEANPADIVTKHASTRQKLEHLVKLFNCHFVEGRPESAPQLRRGEGVRNTLATSGVGALTEQEEDSEGLADIILPHVAWHGNELDERYPSVQVPQEEIMLDVCETSMILYFNVD